MQWLFTLYLSLGIFGIGVILLDLIFSFGEASGEEGDDALDAEADGDFDDSADDSADFETDSDADGDDSNQSVFHYRDGEKMPDRTGRFILKLLSSLRNFVYFSAGFGGMGFFAMLGGKKAIPSLYWSIPFGLVVLIIVRLLKRIQRSTLDSQVDPSMFLLEEAEVIVKIEQGQMGKVRLHFGGTITDYFALMNGMDESAFVGERVRVTEVLKDHLVVEKI